MILILDLNLGNLGSIQNMLKKIGFKSIISNNKKDLEEAKKIILPGVGSFDKGMQSLENLKIKNILRDKVLNQKIPLLGICLGMQLLLQKSEEGKKKGLGFIQGKVIKFSNIKLKVPHMGWNQVTITKNTSLTKDINSKFRFYFVHSYHVELKNSSETIMSTDYGKDFISGLQSENIMGVQFHPEKSHKYGMQILKNFVKIR